ncbi:efflux RND transporter periplasmic adaptor subunit [Mesorhizobium sp. LHD-90]|uniref:efflux RND transporter periplasmic adaptor subunit n=1 Tax=Mesorhizobium sp. LHD-90 TaxID=3071414 RepID=UPI0027DED1A1|nr:efflux RND transporter periplasmic adaptor subunit [Mesorhizobium sp. LHD-90]MDQ6432454.1 efflux RND transporter periplasmic adaptor subunit [Mesorhizobium sp. LHD-90]
MSVWKQLALSLVVLVAAAAAWVKFFPGSDRVLASWGMDWAVAAVAKPEPDAARQGEGQRSGGRMLVGAEPVGAATINDRLQAIGTGRANATVTVNPYTSGRLTAFLVESGAHIEKGQVIATLDSETEEIALERAKIARDDAAARVTRMEALRKSNAATAVQLTEAQLALRNGDLAVHDAQLALDRRSVISPIAGVVGILPIEAGNYVTSQSAIATVDDRSSILVDFWVPERFAAAVKVGAEISATPLANPKQSYKGAVSAVDNRIDDKSRTLWVQARIANPADSLRAGMSFQVSMRFPGDTYPAVSPLAVLWGTDGAFVWTVRDGKVERMPVRIVQRNTETVLVEAPLKAGEMVVTEGVQSVREGGAVRIAGEDEPPRAADASGT